MFRLAMLFIVLALILGMIGFLDLAGAFTTLAYVFFVVFLVLFGVSAIAGAVGHHNAIE